jgi:hypothetical protein
MIVTTPRGPECPKGVAPSLWAGDEERVREDDGRHRPRLPRVNKNCNGLQQDKSPLGRYLTRQSLFRNQMARVSRRGYVQEGNEDGYQMVSN